MHGLHDLRRSSASVHGSSPLILYSCSGWSRSLSPSRRSRSVSHAFSRSLTASASADGAVARYWITPLSMTTASSFETMKLWRLLGVPRCCSRIRAFDFRRVSLKHSTHVPFRRYLRPSPSGWRSHTFPILWQVSSNGGKFVTVSLPSSGWKPDSTIEGSGCPIAASYRHCRHHSFALTLPWSLPWSRLMCLALV